MKRSARGMTLIEITVALMIVVMLFGAAVYGVGALTGARAKESATQLAGTIRALYDSAALTGQTCRIVFTLPEERQEDEVAVKWRAEGAKGTTTASAKRDDQLKADRDQLEKQRRDLSKDDRFRRLDSDSQPTLQELQDREKEQVEKDSQFQAFSNEDVVEKTLPSNVAIEVWTAKQRQPTKHGLAYLYFFPQGYTERAQVWIKQGDNTWTLTIAPLTGKTVIHAEALEVPRT